MRILQSQKLIQLSFQGFLELPHFGQIMIYSIKDHLDPNLPLWVVVQDLYSSADPTQEADL